MRGSNAKSSATKRKSASSSTRSNRSHSVSKSGNAGAIAAKSDQLDGSINQDKSPTLQSEASNSILEEGGIIEGTSGDDLPSESTELTAITLHQPWASLIAAGKKHYETRSWATDYRGLIAIHAAKKLHEDESLISLLEVPAAEVPLGAVVAIAQLTDCILMDKEFILKQSSFEQYLGLWEVGRYAWKLENVRAIEPISATGKQGLWKWEPSQPTINNQQSTVNNQQLQPWNPADFGELHHVAEPWEAAQQTTEWVDQEPPNPNDYEFREEYDERLKEWAARQTDEAEEELANYGEDELCNQLMDGSIYAAELVQDSPMPESNCGESSLIFSANGTTTAKQFSDEDSPMAIDTAMLKPLILEEANSNEPTSLQQAPLANLSQLTESDSLPTTIETASPQSSTQSELSSPALQLLKTSEDCSVALIPPATNQELTLDLSSTAYTRSGSMLNGKLSAAPTLAVPGVEKGSLLLRSPGGLSSGENSRPPGKSRLESQLQELDLIQDGEVAAPEFLELGYNLPVGWTNLQENRTAIELAQVQAQQSSIVLSLELPAEMETTAIEEKPWAIASTGESRLSDSSELNISVSLPPNIGALQKAELISMAQEQHQLICVIERKEFELAIEKLHLFCLAGAYLQEFKKRCQYGEWENQLEQSGISVRSAQNYIMISKNWEIIETKLVSLLAEESQPAIGLKWALETVRDEKKQLKSAAPPKDPDSWRTPNTKDQPVVALVRQALGGEIWLDPCSGSVTNNVPAAVRYFKDDDGLSQHNTWSKTVFINPPFSDPCPWVERCCLEFARGNVSAAIMLLKAGTISNIGTGELINKYASAVCHWRGRINFLNDEGNAVKGSDFDCVLVYFGARLDLFRQAFQQRGTIATIDNHYSSVNKKFLDLPLSEPQTLKSEEKA